MCILFNETAKVEKIAICSDEIRVALEPETRLEFPEKSGISFSFFSNMLIVTQVEDFVDTPIINCNLNHSKTGDFATSGHFSLLFSEE